MLTVRLPNQPNPSWHTPFADATSLTPLTTIAHVTQSRHCHTTSRTRPVADMAPPLRPSLLHVATGSLG